MSSATMSRDMYGSIKSMQFAKIWKAISAEIMPQLIKDEYYVLPYPEEAKSFELFTVYDKFHASTMDKLLKKGRTYRYLGKFSDMINTKASSSTVHNTIFTVCESSIFGIPKVCAFETTQNGYKPKTCINMTFEVTNAKKRWGYVDSIGKKQMIRNSKFPHSAKRIYVINEIFVAEKMAVKASVDEKVAAWDFDGPIALAFKFVKLKKGSHQFYAPVDKFDTLPRWSDLEKIIWDNPNKQTKKEQKKTKEKTEEKKPEEESEDKKTKEESEEKKTDN